MRRKFFTLFSALLCIITVALWCAAASSPGRRTWQAVEDRGTSILHTIRGVTWNEGGLVHFRRKWVYSNDDPAGLDVVRNRLNEAPIFTPEVSHWKPDFASYYYPTIGREPNGTIAGASGTWLVVPFYLPTLLLILPVMIAAIIRRQNLRRQRVQGRVGLCTSCGYDLRATPDRCPECGAVPETTPRTAANTGTMTADLSRHDGRDKDPASAVAVSAADPSHGS